MAHYNLARPHRGLDLATPEPIERARSATGERIDVLRRDIFGGLIHEYEMAA